MLGHSPRQCPRRGICNWCGLSVGWFRWGSRCWAFVGWLVPVSLGMLSWARVFVVLHVLVEEGRGVE